MNKNHEGYADFTACEAIRRADRDRKRKRPEGLQKQRILCAGDGYDE